MMNHDRAKELLTDYAETSLTEDLSKQLEAHVKSCASCQEWLAFYRDLQTALTHPSSDDLALLVARPHNLSDDEKSRLETHVNGCPECSDVVSRSRSALETSKVAAPLRRPSRRLRWALPLAAGLIIGILGGMPLQNDSSSDGIITYHVIGQTHRSTHDLPEVQLERGVDSVVLAIGCPMTGEASHSVMEIVLSDENGRIIWESAMEVEEARRRSNNSQMMLISIPASRLREGRFVIRTGHPGATGRTEFPFVIVKE